MSKNSNNSHDLHQADGSRNGSKRVDRGDIASEVVGATIGSGCAALSTVCPLVGMATPFAVLGARRFSRHFSDWRLNSRFAPPSLRTRRHFLPWKKSSGIDLLVAEKYVSDLKNSLLGDRISAERARDGSRAHALTSRASNTVDPKIPETDWVAEISSECWEGTVPKWALATLRDFGRIKVAATSTAAAPIAIFLRNRKYLQDNDVDVVLDYAFPWGVGMMEALDESHEYDFGFTVDAAFFFSRQRGPKKYRHALTTNFDVNHLLRASGSKPPPKLPSIKRYYVVHGTSAHEASCGRRDYVRTFDEAETDFRNLRKLAQSLENDEAIWVWSCLLADLRSKKLLVSIPESEYRSYRSIIYHSSLENDWPVVRAFLCLFVALWAKEIQNADPMILCQDSAFLSAFAPSIGR